MHHGSHGRLEHLQAVKALYEGYRKQDIDAIAKCIESIGGVSQFRKAKEMLDSLQYAYALDELTSL